MKYYDKNVLKNRKSAEILSMTKYLRNDETLRKSRISNYRYKLQVNRAYIIKVR